MNPEMLRRLKRMQEEMMSKQKELEKTEFTVTKQGIKVVVLGNHTIKSISVDELLIDPEDKEILEDLIVIAINEAIDLVKEEEAKLAPQMPGGLGF
ncbi:YbaB/EbfC family nucleoid-associated protein [Mycoplasma buteonis]|uniref:YbaB/EbfC family nucleoid-associated protein n=1 Tax=Mycoplasma buteonis TaxID=171280 RepID=UPI00056C29FF|nr:YbaB/EbfC family nucleoid-associated protein [Mycoplasma buteonis]